MTENEAIKNLQFLKEKLYNGIFKERLDCVDKAIKALEEIKQYRAIGTVKQFEWCKDASHWKELFKEKLAKYEAIGTVEDIQKVLSFLSDENKRSIIDDLKLLNEYKEIGTVEELKALKEKNVAKKPRFYAHNYYCTECGNLVGNNEFEWQRFLYCDKCGQKFDWE